MSRSVLFVILLALMTTACASAAGPSDSTASPVGFPVSGFVHAGPVCPVVGNPPDPACADRPVDGATVIVQDPSGEVIASVTTGPDGRFTVMLPSGTYVLTPQPVDGLMGTAGEETVVVADASVGGIDFAYDTGIR